MASAVYNDFTKNVLGLNAFLGQGFNAAAVGMGEMDTLDAAVTTPGALYVMAKTFS